MGFPASGKTAATDSYVKKGYVRLNRDTVGGTIAELIPHMDGPLKSGKSVVMDNLFPTKAQRATVVARAKTNKATVRCVWVNTGLEDAQFNACLRMMERVGRILDPKEKTDDP